MHEGKVPARWEEQAALLRRIFFALAGMLVIATIYLMYVAREFVLPVVFALLIAVTLRPAVLWFAARGVPAWLTAGVLAVLLLTGGLAAAYLLSGPVAIWIAEAPQIQQAFVGKLEKFLAPLTRLIEITENIKNAAAPAVPAGTQKVVVSEPAFPALLWAVSYPAAYLVMFGGAVILSLFFMASGNLFYEKLLHVMPTLTDKKNALKLVHDVEREVSAYLLTLTAINFGVGVVVGAMFYAIGMPSAYLWGLLVFALNFIPYAGPLTGVLMAAATAIVTFDSVGYALLAPIVYTAIVTVENQFVSPYVLSQRLEINSVAILLSFAFFAWLWGIAGIVVSVPLLVTLRVFSLRIDSLRVLGEFLGQSTQMPPAGPEYETPSVHSAGIKAMGAKRRI